MPHRAEEHRREFDELGYTVFEGILTPAEIDQYVPLIDALIGPDTAPPIITGDANHRNGRKQLSGKTCDPRLANLGGHPRLVEAAEALAGRRVRLTNTPIPCVTFKSPPGGERFDWGYHVDWPATPPGPGDETNLNAVLHLSRVEPGGGAFMVIPASHRLAQRSLEDPPLGQRALKQDFKDFPGLGQPLEMCVPAGSVIFYHSFLVHDRSENLRDQPRKIVFVHFKPWLDGEFERRDRAKLAKRFHADHLASMDQRLRQLCGLE